MRLIVKGGTVATEKGISKINMLVDSDKIVGFTLAETWNEALVVDAANMFVLPGAVDSHTHISYPEGKEDFFTGTSAAAAGGFTTVVDMDHKSGCTTEKKYREKIDVCQLKAITDFGLSAGIIVEDTDLEELDSLARLGTPYFKLFMPLKSEYDFICQTLTACKETGIPLGIHAEDMTLINYFSNGLDWSDPISFVRSRPEVSEQMATAAVLEMADYCQSSVHFCHTSTAKTAELIIEAKKRGIKATIEVQPHFLILDETSFAEKGPYVKTTPPLRSSNIKDILWRQLAAGIIDFVSSDHFYCAQTEKEMGLKDIRQAPAGIPGLEYAVALTYHFGVNKGRIDLKRFVQVIAEAPARFCGYYPQKGVLAVGSDADFILFNPEEEWVIDSSNMFSKAGYSPYDGLCLKGKIKRTFVRGTEVYDGLSIKVSQGHGRYIPSKRLNRE
ncbi:MAG: dihydroorotase family protein [Dethiobacter sp.]|jgi:dihydroorotase (multifunctional complex type)|nr:dihydroorotase family protein [Dethiobacter sp.]